LTDFEGDEQQPGGPLDDQLQDATRLTEEGRWEEAFELLASLEEDHAEDPMLLCMLGVVAAEVEASESAYAYFRRALAAQPENPQVLVTLGRALARYDDPEAEGLLRLAAVTAPELVDARLAYGAYLAREGIFDVALTELMAARGLEPEDPRVARELGVAHLLGGKAEDGVDALEQASALDAEDADLRFLLGLSLLAVDRVPEAAEELVRAARELPGDAEAQLAAALAAASQGWEDEAWSALSRAEVAPAPPDPQLLREVEEALSEEEESARALLVDEVGPPLLRERLLEGE
jgi:Flp pilus assembly protein TadD